MASPERVRRRLEQLECPNADPPLTNSASVRHAEPRPSARHNLPGALTSFVGREDAIASLRRTLAEVRLVTLVGPGGVGKTRLALRVAADLAMTFPDGVWLIDLAPESDPQLVTQAVAAALLVREQPGRALIATLADALHSRELVLLLDNCEHLVNACAQLCEALLGACPRLRVLATSRQALGVAGETICPVAPLDLPESETPLTLDCLHEYAGLRLFLERGSAIAPSFRATEDNVLAIAQICRQLDGSPLAIELAAARLKLLSPEQIAERLGDRFRLLTAGNRQAPDRHQTLAAALDWSFRLLSSREQVLFRRLAVFAGGWALNAAEDVCSAPPLEALELLDLLAQLVDKSLVVTDSDGAEVRFRMLETIRQYALERLEEAGETAVVLARHRDWCLRLVVDTPPPGRYDPEQARRLAREQDNLRAALRSCIETGQADAGLRLGVALSQLWYVRGNYAEGHARMLELLALPAASAATGVRTAMLNAAGHLAYCQGKLNTAHQLLEESIAISRASRDDASLTVSLPLLAHVVRYRGHLELAITLYAEARDINRRSGKQLQEAMTLALMAQSLFELGDYTQVEALTRLTQPVFEEHGHHWGLILSECMLGRLAATRDDHRTARICLERCLVLAHDLGVPQGMIWPPYFLAQHALDRGHDAQAVSLYADSLRLAEACGDRLAVLHALEGLAAGLVHNHPVTAVRLSAAAARLRRSLGAIAFPSDRARLERAQGQTRARLAEATWDAALLSGDGLSWEQATELALASAAQIGSPRAANAPRLAGLTPRELEVLRLLALAKSNREIAEALVLSAKTVDRHVSNILGKLAVPSRAGAMRIAFQAGVA